MLHKVRFAQFLSFVYKSIRQFLGILATGFFIEKFSFFECFFRAYISFLVAHTACLTACAPGS